MLRKVPLRQIWTGAEQQNLLLPSSIGLPWVTASPVANAIKSSSFHQSVA